ncbi:YjgN family protein [soil metagenome]
MSEPGQGSATREPVLRWLDEPLSPRPAANTTPTLEPGDAQRFSFTGSGSEYFRIWVVNLLLTILTCGIYSAWAKVRRLQYFYRNTRVGHAAFDYHGNPAAILKGRILALVLLSAFNIAYEWSMWAAVCVGFVLAGIMPWLLARSFRFKMVNSSYRGVRFHFRGTEAEAYRRMILFPIVIGVTGFFLWSIYLSFSERPSVGVIALSIVLPLLVLGVTVPLAHYLLKRYQHDNAYLGLTPFFFHARPAEFFQTYARAVGFLFLGTIPAAIFGFLTAHIYEILEATLFGWLFGLLYGIAGSYAFYLFVRSYLESRLQNLIWNHTELGENQFVSSTSARKLLWIHTSNLALITLTLGLYKPFATVRVINYRVQCMTLVCGESLDGFVPDKSVENAGAVGQEAGDMFDIEIAL